MADGVDVTKPRIIGYCWSGDKVLAMYLRMIERLDRIQPSEWFIVTNAAHARFQFLRAGHQSFTVDDIAGKGGPVEIPRAEMNEIVSCDRNSGWRWLPRLKPAAGEDVFESEARLIAGGLEKLFAAVAPDLALDWNGSQTAHSALAWVARRRGVPCFFVERGLLPDTLVVDPRGVNYSSRIAGAGWESVAAPVPTEGQRRSLEEFCRDLGAAKKSVVERGASFSPEELKKNNRIPPDGRVVLLPLQIESDTNIYVHSPHYQTMPAIIRDLQSALASRDDVTLVVKPHPEDKNRLDELKAFADSRTRVVTDSDLHSLLGIADAVAVVNSTTGLEALTQGLPVVLLGHAIYGEKSFTFDLKEKADLPLLLDKALAAKEPDPESREKFYRFLLYLLGHCLFRLTPEDPFDSRENIAQMLFSSLQPERERKDGAAADGLFEENLNIMAAMRGSGADLSLLLIGAPEILAQRLTAGGFEATAVNRKNLVKNLGRLTRRYNYVVVIEPNRKALRMIARMVRADRKPGLGQ